MMIREGFMSMRSVRMGVGRLRFVGWRWEGAGKGDWCEGGWFWMLVGGRGRSCGCAGDAGSAVVV